MRMLIAALVMIFILPITLKVICDILSLIEKRAERTAKQGAGLPAVRRNGRPSRPRVRRAQPIRSL